jgi:hypothetical protein
MNLFEEFTVLIGVLAVLIEGFDYLRSYIHKILH